MGTVNVTGEAMEALIRDNGLIILDFPLALEQLLTQLIALDMDEVRAKIAAGKPS